MTSPYIDNTFKLSITYGFKNINRVPKHYKKYFDNYYIKLSIINYLYIYINKDLECEIISFFINIIKDKRFGKIKKYT